MAGFPVAQISAAVLGTVAALGVLRYAATTTPHSAPSPSVAIAAEPLVAAEPKTPLDVARSVFAGFESVPDDNKFSFKYQDKRWHSDKTERDAFLKRTRDLVPLIFEKFPEADSVIIEAYTDFVDIRGNEFNEQVFSVLIDRKNSDSTNWANVKLDDIMEFADYWQSPAVKLGFPREEIWRTLYKHCDHNGC
jgi:hypothetical protein